MRAVVGCLVAFVLASCATGDVDDVSTTAGGATTASTATTSTVASGIEDDCPQVVAVELTQTTAGVFSVSTTVRSKDVEGVSYADAWEVRDLEGNVLGERILAHPHASEQPFTRSLSGVAIASNISEVEVAARDSVRGFCGAPLTVEVLHS